MNLFKCVEYPRTLIYEKNQADENTASFINVRNSSERVKFGQTFNVFFGYQLATKWKFEAGIGFTDYGEGREPSDLTTCNFKWEKVQFAVLYPQELHQGFYPIIRLEAE